MDTLEEAMTKSTEMEEIMIEMGVDPDIILGKVQRQLGGLSIDNQGASSSRKNEEFKPRLAQNQTIGGGFFKGTIPDVKVDPVAAQETKQRIEIAQMNRTIKQMQNEITRLRRGDNYVENLRMSVPEKRRNPPQENRVRFENMDNPQRPRVPRKPTPNAVVLDDVYDEKMVEQENYYSPDESSETVQMDGCETSMYIFEEGDNDPNSQENVAQTRGFVNRSKNKNDSEKENQKDKEKTNEKREGEKMTDNVGNKKQHLMSNSSQMTYNVVEDLSKLRITLPFTEVVKIPQQRENILRLLDDPSEKEEVVVTSLKQSQNQSTAKLRGKIPPFYISIENHDVALHNCLVDTGATNNIMPLVVMEALGMSCTKYYETGESIYAIDSRKVPAYGEIKELLCLDHDDPPYYYSFQYYCGRPSSDIWSCAGKRLVIHDRGIYNERWKLHDASRKRRSND
jgi:hypothetical protein